MNKRLTELRKSLGLSMEDFGKRLGVGRSTISRLESGSNNITEQMIKSVCREFNVDYMWFTAGVGDMFVNLPDTIIDELCAEYDLDDDDRKIIEEYIKLDKNTRNAIKQYMKNVFKK